MPNPKVVISTIFHQKKEYAYKLFLDWAKSVEYDNLDFIIKVHTGEYGSHGELKAIREQIRLDAIEADASAMLSVDIDTIGPLGAIDEFLATPADMMSGIYFSRIDQRRAVCWKHDDPDQQFLNSEIYTEIDGAGMGFCFMRRAVLEAINFNYPVPDDDYPAWDLAKKAGFRLLSLNLMRCRHYSSEKGYTYYEFGDTGAQPTEEYIICAPDGITHNGNHYPQGKAIVDRRLMTAIKEIDAPYAEGKIKQKKTVVSIVGKGEIGVAPAHTQTHVPGKAQNRVLPAKKKEVGRWNLPRKT